MNTLILRTATRFLLLLLIVLSVFVLLRGHNEPGGGFIGGLLTAGGLVLFGIAFGTAELKKTIRVDPRSIAAVGVVLVVLAAVAGPIAGRPVLTVLWLPDPVPGLGKVSTALLFDLGVHLGVCGAVVLILMALGEER